MTEQEQILLDSIQDHKDAIAKAEKKLSALDDKVDFELETHNGNGVTIKVYIAKTNNSLCIQHSSDKAWIKLNDVDVYAKGLLGLVSRARMRQF